MYIFHPTHQEFLTALLGRQVEFLLIGGYAVNYHGFIRATGDMDIWLKPDNENKAKVLLALEQAGIHPDDIAQVDKIYDFNDVVVFHFGNDPERIDFLTRVQGVEFSKAFERRKILKVKDMEVPILHLDDLIVSKLLAGRPVDRIDVEMLQKINRK